MGITAYIDGHDPEFIASWKGFRNFSEALAELGDEQFPTIIDQLPDGDEGITSPDKAGAMLDELGRFIAQQENITQAVLVDSERDEDISMGSNVMGGVLAMDRVSGYDLGFDRTGFFVRDRWEMNRDLFRAMRVEQKLIHPEEHTVEYIDRHTGQSFRCSVPFGKPVPAVDGIPRMYLRRFHVELRPTAPDRFAYITDPLRVVLSRAVSENASIRWA
jgi:hypothetical protein